MKKFISMFVSLALVLSMMPGIALTAFAEGVDDGQVYTLNIIWNDGGDISVLNNSDILTKEYKTIGGKNACVLTFGEDVDYSQLYLDYELDNGCGLTNTTGPLSSYTSYNQGKECISVYYSRWSYPSDEYEVTMEYTFGTSTQANSMFNSVAPNGVFTLDAVESAASGEYISWSSSRLSDIVWLTLENRGLNTNIYSVDADEKKFTCKVNNISYKFDCTFAYARSNATVLNKNKSASKTISDHGYFRCEDAELIKFLFNGTGDDIVDSRNKTKEIIRTYWDYEAVELGGGGDSVYTLTDDEQIDLGSLNGINFALRYNEITYSFVEVSLLQVQTFFVPDDCAEKDVVSTVQQRIKQATGKDISLEVAGVVSSFEDVDALERYGVDVDNLTKKYYKVEIKGEEYYFIVERNSKKINSTSTECKHEKLVHNEAEEASCNRGESIEYYCCTQCGCCFSDASATQKISGEIYINITDPTKHSLVHHKARNAVGNRQGNIEYWSCSSCGKYFLDSEAENETRYDKVILYAQSWDNSPYLDAENNILYTNGKEVTAKSYYSMVKFEYLDNDGNIRNIYAPAGVTIFAGNVRENGYSNITVDGGIIGNIIVADTDLNTVQGYVSITINGGQVNTITLGGIEDQHSKALSANIVNNSSYVPNVVSGKYCGKQMNTSIINKNNLCYSLTGEFNLAEDVLTWSHTCYNGNKWYKLHTQGGTVEGETYRVYGKSQDLPVPTLEGSTFVGWSDLKYYYSDLSFTDDSPYIYDVYAFYGNSSDTTPETVYLLKKNDKDQYVLQYPLTSGSKHNIYSTTISKYADIRDYAIALNEDKILSFEDQDNNLNEWCKVSDCYSKDKQQSETYCFKINRVQESIDYDAAEARLSLSCSGAYSIDLSMLLYSDKLTRTVEVPSDTYYLHIKSVIAFDGTTPSSEQYEQHVYFNGSETSKQWSIQINGHTYTITFKRTNISAGDKVKELNSRLSTLIYSSDPINIRIADPVASGLEDYQSDLYNLLNSQMGSKYYLALFGLRTDPAAFSNSRIYLHQWNREDQYIAGNTDLEEGVKYYWDPQISFSSDVDGVSYTTYTNIAIPFTFEYVNDIDQTAVARIKENQAKLDSNQMNLNSLYYKDVAILKNLLRGGNSVEPNLSQADTLHIDANTINNEALTSGTNLRIALSYGNIYTDASKPLFGNISATGYYYVDDVYYADLDCYDDDLMYTEGIVSVPSGTRKSDVVEALKDKAETILADSGYTVNVNKVSATDLYSRYSDSDIPSATRAYFTEGGLALYSGTEGTSASNFVGYVEFPIGLGNVPGIDSDKIYPSEVLEYVNYGGYVERNVPSYQVFCVSTERNAAYVLAECDGTIPCEHERLKCVKEESASCTASGHCTYYECTKCGAKFKDSKGMYELSNEEVITEPKTGHSLTHRVAKLPSADKDGNIEYWECADCGEMFLDRSGNTPVEYSEIAIPAIGDAPYLDDESGILYLNGNTVYINEYGGKTMATYYVGSQFENPVSFELPENVQIFVGNLDNDSKWMSELYVNGGHINNIILARASSISHTMCVYIMGGTVDKLTIGSVEGIRAASSRFTVRNTSTCSPQVVVGQWNGKAITANKLLSKTEVLDGEMTGSFQVSNEVKQLPYISINGKQAFLLKAEEGAFADGTKEKSYYGKPEEIVAPRKSGASFVGWKDDYGTAITRYIYNYELTAYYIDNDDPTPASVVLEQKMNGGDWVEFTSLNERGGNKYSLECYIDNNSSYRVAVTSAGSTQYFAVNFDADGCWTTSKKLYSKDGNYSATYTFAVQKLKNTGSEKVVYYEMFVSGSSIEGTYISGRIDANNKTLSVYVPTDALTVRLDYVYANGYNNVDYDQTINLTETTTTAQIICDSDTYRINIIKKNTGFYKTIEKEQDKLDSLSNLCKTVRIADPELTGLESCKLENILGDYYFSTLVLSQWGYDNDTSASVTLYYDRNGQKEVNAEDVELGQKYYAFIREYVHSNENTRVNYSNNEICKEKLVPVKFEYVSTIDQSAVAKIKANDSLLKNLGDIDDSLICYDVELLKNMIANEFSNSLFWYSTSEKEKILISSNKALYKALKGDTNLTVSLMAGGSGDGGLMITDVSANFYYSVDGVLYGKATGHQRYHMTQEMVVNVPTSTSTNKISAAIRSKIEGLFKNKTQTLTVNEITPSKFATINYPSATRAYVTEYGIALYSGTTGTSKSQFIGMDEDWLSLNSAPNFDELNLYSNTTLGYISLDDGTQINNAKAYQVYEINYGGNNAYVLANLADVVCEHESVSHHEALDADCFNDGNTEYYECLDCGNYFSDSTCKNQIAKNSWVVAKNHKCIKHVSHEATCTKDGNTAYWECSECGLFFSDKEGNNEIRENAWIVKSTGHELVHHVASEATCKTVGNIEYWSCVNCGKLYLDYNAIYEVYQSDVVVEKKMHKWNEGSIIEILEQGKNALVEYECVDCHQKKRSYLKIKARVNTEETEALTDENLSNNLKGKGLTAETVKAAMVDEAKKVSGISSERIDSACKFTQELSVEVSSDNGSSYEKMSSHNTPEGGVSVVIPYPEGTDSSYDFIIVHMFDKELGAHKVGDIEVFNNPTKTKTGIKITLESASPVQIISMESDGTSIVSGNLLGYNSNEEVKYEISKVGSENNSVYQSADGEYSFKGLAAGQYTLKVSADGDFVAREYSVDISNNGDIETQDVSIYELGDVTADGVRNAADLTKIARQVTRLSLEPDAYILKLYDTDKNDEIQIEDATKLARFITGIISSL